MTDFEYTYGIPQGRGLYLILFSNRNGEHHSALVAFTPQDKAEFEYDRT